MIENDDDFADDLMVPNAEDYTEVDSSALTWDEETVRETHREISRRASRAMHRGFEDVE